MSILSAIVAAKVNLQLNEKFKSCFNIGIINNNLTILSVTVKLYYLGCFIQNGVLPKYRDEIPPKLEAFSVEVTPSQSRSFGFRMLIDVASPLQQLCNGNN